MILVIVGITLLVTAVAVLLLLRRHQTSSRWLLLLPATLAVAGLAGLGTYLWAVGATDTSQFARALVWGGSGYGDQDRFPFRTIRASPDPVVFRTTDFPLVETFVSETNDQPLNELLEENDTTAFIVLHRDTILFEGYFNGSTRDTVQTSFSVAKSFIATLVGIALDEGVLNSLDDPVSGYIPELSERDARFNDITLRHLITMSSGLSFEDGSSPWADPANTYHGTDLRAAVVSEPDIVDAPGTVFHYNDWNVILLGLVLERATGMPLAEFTETRLWQPMGAEADGSWSLDSESAGFERSFVGLNARAIDFAKLGSLYLNQGRNGTNQVVPAEFVAEATRQDTTTDPASEFQYLWWIDVDHQAFYANGDHGQLIYVDPATEIVIVRNARRGGDVDWIDVFAELTHWLEPQLNTD